MMLAALLLVLGLAGERRERAEEPPLPVALQLTLIAKVYSFDRRAAFGDELIIAVVAQPSYPTSARVQDEWLAAAAGERLQMGRTRIRVVAVEPGEGMLPRLRELGADAAVLAPLRGVEVRRIAGELRRAGMRTVSGTEAYAPHTAVAVLARDGRPHIVIRQAHARAEGCEFSAQLLRLAEVVR